MPTYQLGPEEQRIAVNLAMGIECGTIDIQEVLNILQKDREVTTGIVYFWYHFNDMTRRALYMVSDYKVRQCLEKCYEQTATDYPEIEQ